MRLDFRLTVTKGWKYVVRIFYKLSTASLIFSHAPRSFLINYRSPTDYFVDSCRLKSLSSVWLPVRSSKTSYMAKVTYGQTLNYVVLFG